MVDKKWVKCDISGVKGVESESSRGAKRFPD
jgi:hypothetical protein